jgi:hypothetical protein
VNRDATWYRMFNQIRTEQPHLVEQKMHYCTFPEGFSAW